MLGLEKRLLDGMCFRIGASRVRWMDGLSPSIYPAWCLEEKGGECRAWKCLACAPRVKKLRNGRVRALDWGEGREKDSSERILSHVPTARTLPSSASLASSASHCTSRDSFPLVIYSIHGTLAIYTKSLTLAYYSLGFQAEIHGVGSGPLRRCIPGKEERRRKTRTPGRLDKANEAGLNPVRSGRSRTNASPSSSPFLSQTSRSSSHTSSSPSTRLRVCATRLTQALHEHMQALRLIGHCCTHVVYTTHASSTPTSSRLLRAGSSAPCPRIVFGEKATLAFHVPNLQSSTRTWGEASTIRSQVQSVQERMYVGDASCRVRETAGPLLGFGAYDPAQACSPGDAWNRETTKKKRVGRVQGVDVPTCSVDRVREMKVGLVVGWG